MASELLKTVSPLVLFSRSRHVFKKKPMPGGIRYPGGIIYYPRFPDQEEPEHTPTKLFRVERIKSLKHNPYWLKKIMKDLGIDEEDTVTVVKNVPDMNLRLWKVKHLIRVTPITFPYGEPTEEDIKYTTLKENGECIVTKRVGVDPKVIEAKEKFDSDPRKMNSDTLKRDSRLKWMNPWKGGY